MHKGQEHLGIELEQHNVKRPIWTEIPLNLIETDKEDELQWTQVEQIRDNVDKIGQI